MISITSSDVIKRPSFVTNPSDITFIEDAKKHIIKSVVLPYSLYEKIKEQLEDELYLSQNREALSTPSREEFEMVEEAYLEDHE
ncbi:hypothetical protein [Nitratifractor sp.]